MPTLHQHVMDKAYPAIYAHTVRKAALREDDAGNADLAEELREAMRFIECQADPATVLVDVAETALWLSHLRWGAICF